MKRVNWKWFLPIAQLALALACHVYEPHEYRVRARLDGAVDNMEYTFQHSPALSGRLSRGINFPALVLDYPFRNEDDAIYKRNGEYTLIWIAPKDIGFFFGIVLFWCWVGRKLDESQRRSPGTKWHLKARIAGLTCGALFGIAAGTYAIHMIASKWRPERHIGTFGMVWSVALLTYFIWQLTREFSNRARLSASRS